MSSNLDKDKQKEEEKKGKFGVICINPIPNPHLYIKYYKII